MGLDITVYKKLKKVENPKLDKDGYIENWDSQWQTDNFTFQDSIWEGRREGIDAECVYTWEDSFHFRAGSYSGYNWWRNQLEKFAMNIHNNIINNEFIELILFADNEGVIGPVVSEKLFSNFKDNLDLANEHAKIFDEENAGYWLYGYKNWMEAFEMASVDGAVVFH